MTWNITVRGIEEVGIPWDILLVLGAGVAVVGGLLLYFEERRREELMMAMLRR